VADQTLPVVVPENLKLVSDDDLQQVHDALKARGKALKDEPSVTPELVAESLQVQQDYQRVSAEIRGRAVSRAEAAEAEARRLEKARAEALDSVLDEDKDKQALTVDKDGNVTPAAPAIDPEAIAAASARGTVAALASMGVRFPNGMKADEAARNATTALAAAAIRTQPRDQLPARRLAVTASVDIPGYAGGQDITNLDDLVTAVQKRAKAMPITRDGDNARGAVVASIHNEQEHVVDDRHTPGEVETLLNDLRSRQNQESLLAGGGWCAPSDIRYDFFNVADPPDGLVDLPTLGVTRGGIRYPTSPSLADVFGAAFGGFSTTFSVNSVPFLWSESDDVATVTGAPNKPTVRVPCPSFNEQRLECYGFQVTAGNLTDSAYPEATRNFLRLVLAAHEHAMNGRLIALMVAASSTAVTTGGFAVSGAPVFNQVIGGLALAAADYRARYGMNSNTVLEAVAPRWILDAIVADLAWRAGAGTELLGVTTAQINGFFANRGVRVQWVDDWQVRASGLPGHSSALVNWPTSADVLVYAAGTFIRGDGMTLDLGVIRDSVLNAENDFTAAFTEECHLVARVGHESRRYNIDFSVNGASPAAIAAGNYL
jgi:hypothetical protein